MPDTNNLTADINLVKQLLDLVEANQEIAVMRIAALRQTVLSTRALSEGLSHVYSEVKASHAASPTAVAELHHGSALILLSTDERLSGPITAETSRYFNSLAAESDDAIVIVGRLGRDRFRAAFPRREVVYFDISEQNAKLSDLAPLLQHLLRYRHLRLVYPAFQNVVRQKPKLREVGSDVASKMASAKHPMPTVSRYLFEPTLPEVVRFFDTELFGLVLKQLFAELDLSLVGSRITSLESASTTIAREVKHLEHVRRLHKRRTRNRKQRERLSGRQLWAV